MSLLAASNANNAHGSGANNFSVPPPQSSFSSSIPQVSNADMPKIGSAIRLQPLYLPQTEPKGSYICCDVGNNDK